MQLLVLIALLFPALAPPLTPLQRFGPCEAIVVGQMVACANGRAYVIPGWHDAGPLRPMSILVPTLPER